MGGPPGELAAIFADGTAGFYDVRHSHVDVGTDIELLDSQLTTAFRSSDGRRLYIGYVDGRIQTLDTDTAGQIAPIIRHAAPIGSISATTGRLPGRSPPPSRTGLVDDRPRRDDRRAARRRCPTSTPPTSGPTARSSPPTSVGEITEYDLDTLQPLGSFPGVRGLVT